jgi:hypothetical protein
MNDAATSEEIYQDTTDTTNTWRVHQYDDAHRKYNEAVEKLVDDFIRGHKIAAENPMTMTDAAEILWQIEESTDPLIAGYREMVKTYIRTQGKFAEQRYREYRSLPGTARGSKKATMPQDRVMSPEEQATASAVEDRIYENLLPLGLEPNRDYWFYDRVPRHHIFVGIERRELLISDVIVACSKALAGENDSWFIWIGTIDPNTREFSAVVSIKGENIGWISFEDWVMALVFEAWERIEAAKSPPSRPFSVGALKDPSTWSAMKRRIRGE